MNIPSHFQNNILDKVRLTNEDEQSNFINQVIDDFWICLVSREMSLQGRKEVLTGKAKFGIFGDGKEVPQVALAKAFKKGDYRSGYYRDQTWMMSCGVTDIKSFFAQLYSDSDHDPFSSGRQMNSHFATAFSKGDGEWENQINQYNISAGISSTGGQMGRALGLAFASKKYKELTLPEEFNKFSRNGNEICFCTIGDGSTSEGVFWESLNAAAVEKVPLMVVVWDDGYSISVPIEKQTVKSSISRALEGFLREENTNGIDIYVVDGWDYPSLCVCFDKAAIKMRNTHVPALVHVKNLTQPQGHSTSGSHERYKSKERMRWETDFDCISKMEEWIQSNGFLTEEDCKDMRREARAFVRKKKNEAWSLFIGPSEEARIELQDIYKSLAKELLFGKALQLADSLNELVNPVFADVLQIARQLYYHILTESDTPPERLKEFIFRHFQVLKEEYGTHLYASGKKSALNIPVVEPYYSESSSELNGYQVINTFFDHVFAKYPELIAFGEDVGKIGDVNQGLAGLQQKYGEERVFDVGIREWTIIGQGIGCAMRGLRPITEIQYLDYLVYALPIITDDLATMRYRSNNLQQAPMIIRTRGHRLEGIWHTGSPLGLILNSFKGIYVLVPRNMVQAAGMYNTMLQSSDPAIIIECLNGYRLKELLPDNIGEYTVPLGRPDILTEGRHVTIVTYGSCIGPAMEAVNTLEELGISVELIDVQTLIPFDLEHIIVNSIKKTNRVLFLDEDVPGGGTAFMMQQVLEVQNAYAYLDAKARTLTAKDHRTPYGSDGDYYSKPQAEDIVEIIFEMVYEKSIY